MTHSSFRSALLFFGILINTSVLFSIKLLFKNQFALLSGNMLSSTIGIGSSFYLLQATGYLIDVYYDKKAHEKKLLDFSLYICFFPQLILGPIERSYQLLPQFKKTHPMLVSDYKNACIRIFVGLFKKIVIAENLYDFCRPFLEHFESVDTISLTLVSLCYISSLYCEFSGYIDIAIGGAELFGIKLAENFNRPFFSKNIPDFISRWNMTFYYWVKDYISLPIFRLLGKTHPLIFYTIICLFSALWHSPRLHFLYWGLHLYLALLLDYFFLTFFSKQKSLRTILLIYGSFFMTAFFNFPTSQQANGYIWSIITFENLISKPQFFSAIDLRGLIIFIFLGLLILFERSDKKSLREYLPQSSMLRNIIYIGLILSLFLLSKENHIAHAYMRF